MYIADLHIHSKYSRATSKEAVPEYLDLWARRKGISLLGTGDFTHPVYREELREKLAPAEEGLYRLREELSLADETTTGTETPRFVISGEISSIYKKNGRVRKVHNVILLPSLEAADALSHKLEAIGNIHSDGRPILGLDSRDLLEITLESCPEAVFIPAHIWTPHFSLFGAFSGFDTMEECFEDMTPYIHAVETGLSSDPAMNWRLSALDGYTLLSNSDAHSPAKLGREANLLDISLSYPALANAIAGGKEAGFAGTIEFFPEEGKYHYDGHRKCELCLTSSETEAYQGRCPVCGKKITIGVQHRVEELADRPEGFLLPGAVPYESLVPLPEVIGASTGRSANGVKVQALYEKLLQELGPEFHILRKCAPEEVERVAGPCVAEGIRRLRAGKVVRSPGFDGEYGTIQLLAKEEIDALSGQMSFFGVSSPKASKKAAYHKGAKGQEPLQQAAMEKTTASLLSGLNAEQAAAVTAGEAVVSVVAGPGTGKTKTLVSRIAYLIEHLGIKPGEITAVTFTNKAAGELRQRLEGHFGGKQALKGMEIGTFHSICLRLLQKHLDFALVDTFEALDLAADALRQCGLKLSAKELLSHVSAVKSGLLQEDASLAQAAKLYSQFLKDRGLFDFDDLLIQCLGLFEGLPKREKRPFTYLCIDEFQDVSPVQYKLAEAWGKESKGFFVIGDPDQSIYGFRGSSAHCFSDLRKTYPDLLQVHLVDNYRSTPEILEVALPVISKNPGPVRRLVSTRPSGPRVRLCTADSERSEAIFMAKEINRMVGGIDMLDVDTARHIRERESVRDFSDIAILYRTHHQAKLIEKCLRTEGIPYIVTGRDDTLSDEKVRGIICLFRFLNDPRDVPALVTSLKSLWNCPADLVEGLALLPWEEASLLKDRLEGIHQVASVYETVGPLLPWWRLVDVLLPQMAEGSPYTLIETAVKQLGLTASKPLENLQNMTVFYKNMPSFLAELALGSEGDVRRAADRYTSGAVSLMTLHGSKGLEFPVVFLSGVRKGSIPLESVTHPADLEEERRLFYVGMTRAKEELILLTGKEPSSFLADIPKAMLEEEDLHRQLPTPKAEQLSLF